MSPRWQRVTRLPKGTVISKGRRGTGRVILHAARSVTDPCGIYGIASSQRVRYCGSWREYCQRGHFTNFGARMAQYLGNHRSSPMNTNLRIFNCLNAALRHADVEVCVLFADAVIVDGRSLNWGTFATNPRLVRKAEKQLIELGKGRGHCTWNRTGRRR